MSRPSTGVAFSGGGSRGYVAALAQLGALRALGLSQHIRYCTAISGGGWAASVHTYYQPGAPGAPADDDELFGGAARPPGTLDAAALAEVPPRAARGFVSSASLFDEAVRELQAGRPAEEAWRTALWRVVLRPAGIPESGPFTWSDATAADIAARNAAAGVEQASLLTPTQRRPFLILGITALGPLALLPHRPLRLRAYTLLEATPLYVGHPRTLHVRYSSSIPGVRAARSSHLVGGLLETFAFGGAQPPERGLGSAATGTLAVPVSGQRFSLAAAAAASSYAPGGLFATQLPSKRLGRHLGVALPYWAPSQAAPRSTEFLYADGGCVMNPALISLIQRRVRRVVAFCNFQTRLRTRAEWDPYARAPTPADISEEVPSFFGMALDSAAWCFARNAVFAQADFAPVVAALQDAAAAGRGAVATVELETVANAWWGIPAGQRVTVTWCYLAAAPEWAAQLPPATAARLTDAKDAQFGPTFPHYGTMDLALAPPQVNLLHEMCSWVVTENADAFRAAFLPERAPRDDAPPPPPRAQGLRDDRGRGPLAGGRAAPGGRTAVAAAAAAAAVAAAGVEPAGAVEATADAAQPQQSRLSRAVRALLNALPSG